MKKAFAVFAVCLLLTAGVGLFGMNLLHEDRDQVEVTAATLSGDPAAAEGLVATQAAHLNDQLRWDLTIPLDRPEETTVLFDSRWSPDAPAFDPLSLDISTPMNASYGFSGHTLEQLTADVTDLYPLAPMLEDVFSRAPRGQTYIETVSPRDYWEVYPLRANVYGLEGTFRHWEEESLALDQGIRDFFSFPIPEDTLWTVIMETDETGNILSLEVSDPDYSFGLGTLSVSIDNVLFFTFDQYTAADFSNTPGGFGLYRLPLPQPQQSGLPAEGQTVSLPDPADLANVFPLPEEVKVLDLSLDHDGTALLLTYCLGSDYHYLVLDPQTMEVLQTLDIPAEDQVSRFQNEDGDWEQEVYPGIVDTLAGENFLLFYGAEALHLFSLDQGTYTYAFSAPMTESLRWGDHYLTGAWNGETLALGVLRSENYSLVTGLTLSLFRQGELIYQGRYDTSLDSGPGQASPNNYQDRIQLVYDQELALHWE